MPTVVSSANVGHSHVLATSATVTPHFGQDVAISEANVSGYVLAVPAARSVVTTTNFATWSVVRNLLR